MSTIILAIAKFSTLIDYSSRIFKDELQTQRHAWPGPANTWLHFVHEIVVPSLVLHSHALVGKGESGRFCGAHLLIAHLSYSECQNKSHMGRLSLPERVWLHTTTQFPVTRNWWGLILAETCPAHCVILRNIYRPPFLGMLIDFHWLFMCVCVLWPWFSWFCTTEHT